MSTRTVDILAPTSPGFGLGHFLGIFTDNTVTGNALDAPSYYTAISMRLWGSGTRTRAYTSPARTVTDSISYDVTKAFTRVDHRAGASFINSNQYADGKYDQFSLADLAATECHIGMRQGFGYRQLPHLARQYLYLRYFADELDYVIGSRTVDFDDPGTPDTTDDILADLNFGAPYWDYLDWGAVQDGTPWDRWVIPFAPYGSGSLEYELDISSINWRDLRGAYTASVDDADEDPSWDTNNIVHNVSLTLS